MAVSKIEEVRISSKYFSLVRIEFDEVVFQLFESFGPFLLLLRAMSLTIAKDPQRVTIHQHGMNEFAIPFGGIKFLRRLSPEQVIVL